MKLPVFKLEDYLGQWEFKAPYLLCCSDAQTLLMKDLIAMADEKTKKLFEELHLGYTEVSGHPLLREAVASLYSTITAEKIQMFSGAEEGIFCTFNTLISPKSHVIVVTPAYQSLVDLPRSLNADVTTISLTQDAQWQLDVDAVARAFRSNTKLVVLNFPHNPTGAVLERKSLDRIIALCKTSGAYLFSDEVFRFMEFDEQDRLPPIADLYEKGISLSVLSKSFGLPGLRIGWIASHDKQALEKIAQFKHYTSICNSAPSEILALMAIASKDKILARVHRIMQSNLALLDEFFAKHKNLFRWVRPKGACFGFAELLGDESVEEFCRRLVEKKGVLLMPASIFDMPGQFFRIGFGRENMKVALDKLSELIAENP